jgi:hypothetical protein
MPPILECDQCGAKPSQWGAEWAGWDEKHPAGSHCPMDKIQGCDGVMRLRDWCEGCELGWRRGQLAPERFFHWKPIAGDREQQVPCSRVAEDEHAFYEQLKRP